MHNRWRINGIVPAFCLMVFLAFPVYAGGVLSSLYFGESVFSEPTRSQGMGGAGLALAEGVPDPLNPASLPRSPLASFSVTYRPQITWAQDNYTSRRDVSGQLSSLVFSLPVGNNLFLGAGVEQLHSTFYNSSIRDTTEFGQGFEKRFSKSGGVYAGGLSLAYRPVRGIHIGLGYRWLFGGITEETEVDFDTAVFTDTNDELTQEHSGGYPCFGVALSHDKIGFGIYYRPKIEGDGTFELLTVHRVETVEDFPFTLPERYGFGIRLGPWSGLNVVGDIWREPWSQAKYGTEVVDFQDVTALFFGIEYNFETEEKRLFPPLRLGFRRIPGYAPIRLEDGTTSSSAPSDEAISIGTSFSAGKGKGSFDIAASLGSRGGILRYDVRERYIELSLGFVGFEPWSRRRLN